MGLADFRTGRPRGYGFPRGVELGLAGTDLPGSSADLSVPAVPNHPAGPRRCTCSLTSRRVLASHTSGRLTARNERNEAESGSRFRITADTFASGGLERQDYSGRRPVSYMANEHLPWSVPFN